MMTLLAVVAGVVCGLFLLGAFSIALSKAMGVEPEVVVAFILIVLTVFVAALGLYWSVETLLGP